MGGRLCYAVYPGDAATALIPFDARTTLATPAGPKTLSVEQLVPGQLTPRVRAFIRRQLFRRWLNDQAKAAGLEIKLFEHV